MASEISAAFHVHSNCVAKTFFMAVLYTGDCQTREIKYLGVVLPLHLILDSTVVSE